MTPPDRPAPTPESQAALDEVTAISQELGLYDRPVQPAPDLDARMERWQAWTERDAWPFNDLAHARDAITTLRAQLAEAQAVSLKYQHAYGDRDNEAHRLSNRVAALEAALKDADGWLPIALCPTDGVWRLVKLSDGNEAVAAFDGVGLLSKKRWQTKVFLTHRPACPSPINDLVTQPARDVFLIADLENGVYPTHFRPNDTVFGLPTPKGDAT